MSTEPTIGANEIEQSSAKPSASRLQDLLLVTLALAAVLAAVYGWLVASDKWQQAKLRWFGY